MSACASKAGRCGRRAARSVCHEGPHGIPGLYYRSRRKRVSDDPLGGARTRCCWPNATRWSRLTTKAWCCCEQQQSSFDFDPDGKRGRRPVAGGNLFSARGYNIESLTVAPTDDPTLSQLTLVTYGNEQIIEQIVKQLNKLIDVVKLIDLSETDAIERELMLVKTKASGEQRAEMKRLADIFGGMCST